MINLDLDPNTVPDDATTAQIRTTIMGSGASHILWESDPVPAAAAYLLEALGLRSETFQPCETRDDSARKDGLDYMAVMRRNVENMRPLFEAKGASGW